MVCLVYHLIVAKNIEEEKKEMAAPRWIAGNETIFSYPMIRSKEADKQDEKNAAKIKRAKTKMKERARREKNAIDHALSPLME